MINAFVKPQGNLALLLLWHVPGELKGLPVHGNRRAMAEDHVLEGLHGALMQSPIPTVGHAMVKCIIWIIDVQLSIYRKLTRRRKNAFSTVWQSTMVIISILTTTIVKRFVRRRHKA